MWVYKRVLPVVEITSTAQCSDFHARLQNEDSREKVIEDFEGIRQTLKYMKKEAREFY